MKDQYVGDVNDYLKYAMLRALTGSGDLRLCVVWMLTDGDNRTDGQRLAYLAQPDKYRHLDPALFDALRQLVRDERRSVEAVEAAAILPNAVFVADLLRDDTASRRRYFDQVDRIATGSAIVFLDPDNGFEVGSVRAGARNSAKYLFWSEARDAYARGRSLVVYQHFPRRPRGLFLGELTARARELTEGVRSVALQTSHVAFLVIPQPHHESLLISRLSSFSSHAAPYATGVFEGPPADEEGATHVRLIGEVAAAAAAQSLAAVLWGGWGVDFLVGQLTRDHEDIDFAAWSRDADTLEVALTAGGFASVDRRISVDQRCVSQTFAKAGERVHVTFLERLASGLLAPPGDASKALLPGLLDGEVATFDGVTCRVATAEALCDAIERRRQRGSDRGSEGKQAADLSQLRAILRNSGSTESG